ncbi:MAG: hypothetical protein ACI396_07225, partial [Acutalibacteraceae bacterium]
NPEELPGYKKQSFKMAFGGGEIWFEHLDGIYSFEDLVLSKLKNDSKTFCRPSMPSLICFNLDETAITDRIIAAISIKLLNSNKRFTRVCFVGADRAVAKKLKKALKYNGFALHFTKDFEKAKEWLVSEKIFFGKIEISS